MYNADEVLSSQPKIFYICKPYLFLHIYDPLIILSLAVTCVSCKCLRRCIAIHKHFTFGNHTCSFTSMTTYWFLTWQTYFFLSVMPIPFEIVYTCVYIQNTNAHEMLNWEPKILYISKPYLYFTSMIPLVFDVWQLYLFFANAHDIFTAIHKHFTFDNHLWPLMHSFFGRHVSFEIVHTGIYTKY